MAAQSPFKTFCPEQEVHEGNAETARQLAFI